MDFREVWMNTETLTQSAVQSSKMCSTQLIMCQDISVVLILLLFLLLLTNFATLLYFNRHYLLRILRHRFVRLSTESADSAAFNGECSEMSTELKG